MTDIGTFSLASALVEKFEGCRLAAYRDCAEVWTIGWGHTGPEVHAGLVWSQQQCDETLERDLALADETVGELWPGQVFSPWQRAALISLVYNFGSKLQDSQLQLFVKEGNWAAAARQWIRWDHTAGKETRGLLRRRLVEAAMFVEGS